MTRVCRWCSKPVPKGRRKYCSDECSDRYFVERLRPLWWPNASRMALERANHRCEECGLDGCGESGAALSLSGNRPLEVHHIIPLEPGEQRFNSPKNRQDNLQVLCRPCHEGAHHPLAAIKMPRGRLPLFEWAGVRV